MNNLGMQRMPSVRTLVDGAEYAFQFPERVVNDKLCRYRPDLKAFPFERFYLIRSAKVDGVRTCSLSMHDMNTAVL